jgi:hypothetical protein
VAEAFLFTTSKPVLWPTQPPVHLVPEALFPAMKQLRLEIDHSHQSSAEVKNVWSHIFTSHMHLNVAVLI